MKTEQELKDALLYAYHWGRDNGEGRSEKNFNDMLKTSWAQSLLTKQDEQFKPCGEGENICNCKSESECGYLEQPQADDIKELLSRARYVQSHYLKYGEVQFDDIEIDQIVSLLSEIQSLKQTNEELSKKIPEHHFMDSEGNLYKDQDPFGVDMSGTIRIRQISKHDKQ